MEDVARRAKRRNRISAVAIERRIDLQEAAIRCIANRGYAAVSTTVICDDGGFSRGLIGHYFKGKDELLLEAINLAISQWRAAIRQDLEAVGTDPTDRLHALVRAGFSPSSFKRKQAAVWVALVGNAKWSPPLGDKYRQLWQEYRVGVTVLFTRATAQRNLPVEAEAAALMLSRAIEGFWVCSVADPEMTSIAEAEKACHVLVDLLLGEAP